MAKLASTADSEGVPPDWLSRLRLQIAIVMGRGRQHRDLVTLLLKAAGQAAHKAGGRYSVRWSDQRQEKDLPQFAPGPIAVGNEDWMISSFSGWLG